jgi:hypothetical protein
MRTHDAYDIIGDIHGHASSLTALLAFLGYQRHGVGAWRHPERTAIFVGDFIDRGPEQVETYRTVRTMVEAGSALAVMGNHEFNAIAWATPDPDVPGAFLRPRTTHNLHQHAAFLAAVGDGSMLHREVIDWFMTLPLWLDLPELRVVHACWHAPLMAELAPRLAPGNRLTPALVEAGSRRGSFAYRAIEALLKGIEVELPAGSGFSDKDGHRRTAVRVRWWANELEHFDKAAMPLPPGVVVPPERLPHGALHGYDSDKPLFIGHYWLTGDRILMTDHIACVDYSAGRGDPLVAYRFDGETRLDAKKLVVVTD